MICLILCFLGFFIIPELSVRLNPSNSLPSISVNYNWANASSNALDREVTSILEGGFGSVKGVQKISSQSSKGSGVITLEFDKHTSLDNARFEIATIVRQLYKKLPDRVSYPTLRLNRPDENRNNRAFLSYSVNASEAPYVIQETVKNQIVPVIGALQDIDKTNVFGANEKEYVVYYNFQVLKQLSIDKKEMIEAIQQFFSRKSLGQIYYNEQYLTLSINASEEINWRIPMKKIDNRLIYLDDLATIKEQEQETTAYYRVNGKNAITLSIYATKNANTIALVKEVEEIINSIEGHLPAGYKITEVYNSTEYLQKELNKIYNRALYTVVILLVFILMVSRSFKYLSISILSLIANLGIAFLFYYIFDIEIQLYSLAGVTISIGLIIDNSIVMIDHIKKQGNTSVFVAILASTLTTIGALSIIYFLDEKYKVNLIDFALVIIINLMVSLFIALFLIPALLERIKLKQSKSKKMSARFETIFFTFYSKLIRVLLRFKKIAIIVVILVFGIPFFMLPKKLENNDTFLEKVYNSSLGSDWYRANIRPSVDRYLGGTFRLFNYYVFDNAYYNRNEETKLYVSASMEKGATIHQMNEAFLTIENYLRQFSGIKQYITTVYSSDYAQIEITFTEQSINTPFPFTLKSLLVKKALDLGGIDWNVYGVGQGFNNGSGNYEITNFSVDARGYNYDDLNAWADTLRFALEEHPRIQKVYVKDYSSWSDEPSYRYQFTIDKEQLALKNRSLASTFEELKSLTLSKQSDVSLNIKGKYAPIRLVSDKSQYFDLWKIQNNPIDSLSNPLVLSGISNTMKVREEENIYKENQEYIRLVQFQYTGARTFGSKVLDEQLDILKKKLPLGYTFDRSNGRSFLLNSDKNNNYTLLLSLILGIIYLVCSVLFESLRQPVIILSVVPISFIGVFLTFYLFGFNFDQGGLASFVLLSGITVNASIFIVNGFNALKKLHPNKDYVVLYIEAFKQKIFPIILTIFSTILGFIPFVKDGQNEVFWFALGIGTIGGLIFSLLGILLYLPIFTLKKKFISR